MLNTHSTVECRTCGHQEEHDPKCPKHECEDCGAYGEHHCPVACDDPACAVCDSEAA